MKTQNMSSVVDQEAEREPMEEGEDETAPKTILVDEYGGPLVQKDEEKIAARKRPLYRRPALMIAAVIIFIIAMIFGVRYWLYARSHEYTDDAFIDAHVVQISPKVSGYIVKLYVESNQQVNKGDLLAEIDPRDYEARLAQARAALAAGEAKLKEANSGVDLTRANMRANVQQATAGVQRARSGVGASTAETAAERARTTQAVASISTAQANLEQARAQVAAADAEVSRAQADVSRYQQLYSKDEVSRQRLDQAIAAARTAEAQANAARERVAAAAAQVNEAQAARETSAENVRKAQSQVGGAQAQVNEALGRLAEANTGSQQVAVSQAQAATAGASMEQLQAAVAQAELELSYTKIYAPDTGRITHKSAEQGALVQSGQPLMAIVPGNVWVTANFKESQIGRMQRGQPVDIEVDAYPDKTFKGHVDSIQAGTGAQFSLLPPENATGNYVKVVQRVPVKIVFDEPPDPKRLLAPGMSVVPEVKVR
ncbi:MAG: HlyD family secretion protein [Pyrinomonadaceae bacterium]